MTEILSFNITGSFASFRDPSVTSNQLVYYIPSKTAVVGILGALIGVKRSNTLGALYEEEYLDFFSKLKIGIVLENNPKKITYFTNYRSLKKAKTKPVKKEILEAPEYRFFVYCTDDVIFTKIKDTIVTNSFSFMPYLGHAYCPAKISNLTLHNATQIDDPTGHTTDGVILDESTSNENQQLELIADHDDSILIVERHLHHFFEGDEFKSRVYKHWIPVDATSCEITHFDNQSLSEFYKIKKKVYCLY